VNPTTNPTLVCDNPDTYNIYFKHVAMSGKPSLALLSKSLKSIEVILVEADNFLWFL